MKPLPEELEQIPCPRDPVWGREGEILYGELPDRLFGVQGRWNLRRTRDSDGGALLWLDPRPTAASLPAFYRNYYTHADHQAGHPNRAVEWIYRRGVKALPYMRERVQLERMYLEDGPGRRVLELGCGDGSRLALLREAGWQVTGQEIDASAAQNARSRLGLDIRVGEITAIDLPEGGFDAVVMNHVIEHLLDPLAVLARCRQLLRPGGVFVVTTPNIDSYGHATFGRDWLGLDPPRHLQLFSLAALRALVGRAGFSRVEGWTTCARAQAVGGSSLDIRRGTSPWNRQGAFAHDAAALLFQWRAWWHYRRDPRSGEELVVRASD
jgi:SAM-dependent methyltransferase